MEYNKKFELVGQIEGVLNKMCFAYESDCHGCPCHTNENGVCELQKAVTNLYVILGENKYEAQNETLD